MAQAIARHNKGLLSNQQQEAPPPCKCKNVVYQAVVEESVSKKVETYTGLTYRSFKERHKEHMDDLADPAARSSSRLAGHVWGLKDKGLDFDISWRILAKAQPFNPVTRKCNLCLKEKPI